MAKKVFPLKYYENELPCVPACVFDSDLCCETQIHLTPQGKIYGTVLMCVCGRWKWFPKLTVCPTA